MDYKSLEQKKILLILLKAILIIVLFMSFTLLFGCSNHEYPEEPDVPDVPEEPKIFGMFAYKGHQLYCFEKNDITATEAKNIVNKSQENLIEKKQERDNKIALLSIGSSFLEEKVQISDELVNKYLAKYAECQVILKYYEDGQPDQQTEEYKLSGTDLKNMIKSNQLSNSNQLVIYNIIVFPEMIDYMEECNTNFRNSAEAVIAPFKDIFTYHTSTSNNLVIRLKDFAEISASSVGGISSNFRQDTEVLYDYDNKISKWQTSLGLSLGTMNGTVGQGYIFEAEFKWIDKE